MPESSHSPANSDTCIVEVVLSFVTMAVNQSTVGFRFAMHTSTGRVRSGNEDFCVASPDKGIFIVCDGMGGAAAGEVASELAATTFQRHIEMALPFSGSAERLLGLAVWAANTAVYKQSRSAASLRGMGTTLVALLLESGMDDLSHKLWLTHVGDSRCYRLRDGAITQLTEDHSLVQEQILAGQLTAEQAERSPMRNIITRAIGSAPNIDADILSLDPLPGDLYLLASDGLTRELADGEIEAHLTGAVDLERACEGLVAAANAAGGHDNITVLLLRIGA